jgi:Ala-tRNA(Pro) deacylase
MTTLDRLLQYLMRFNARYEHDRHPLSYTAKETAQAEHVPERTFAKTVILHSETGYAMAVLPANMQVDLVELRELFGFQRLRLATEPELQDLFPDCDLGAQPPFGNDALYEMPVYADAAILREPIIAFNAGTHRDVVRMPVQEWQALVKPSVVEFARRVGA